MNRTKYINKLIQENGYKSYLEIGLGNGNNFKNIICENKTAVDPEWTIVKFSHLRTNGHLANCESDYFFDIDFNQMYDLVFIDGLHEANQVIRDIQNSWNCLKKSGIILIHDIDPPTKESQLVPKVSSPWKGNVWRAWIAFLKVNSHIRAYSLKVDTGLGVIFKSDDELKEWKPSRINWETFLTDKPKYLKWK